MLARVKMRAKPEVTNSAHRKSTAARVYGATTMSTGTLQLVVCWLLAMLALLSTVMATRAVVLEEQTLTTFEAKPRVYDYNCFSEAGPQFNAPNVRDYHVGLQVSNRALHQIMSRIFAIVLREKLNYKNVSLVPLKYNGNIMSETYEQENYRDIFDQLRYSHYYNMTMINVAVWMPALVHSIIPDTIYEAGNSITPGRFGWFVPEEQVDMQDEDVAYSLHYNVFLNMSHPHYGRYVISEEQLNNLRDGKKYDEYISANCIERQGCVTLLAEHKHDTAFALHHIQHTNSYVNVLWLGDDFRKKFRRLQTIYRNSPYYRHKRFILLHWTPSIVIDNAFAQITLPHCEDLGALQSAECKYELTPVLKYYDKRLAGEERLVSALRAFNISDLNLDRLQHSPHWQLKGALEDVYNEVACEWLRSNAQAYTEWITSKSTITLYIGGIFPLTDTSRGHRNLEGVVRQAVAAVKRSSLLQNYNLDIQVHDGQCKPDEVMKLFIHYFTDTRVLGVLGPACSETVEPIAGISKHTNMAVISYSAEGASFTDRQTYPYFFRTIGSNRQYEDVYISLMQHLGWRRVAALTEDGQKYTEYISHMETAMKQHNLELIINKKFLSDVTPTEMNKYLLDLKQKHAKIIIADIHNRNAELALCEAYKLGMTAHEGYVWFLPSWLSKDWQIVDSNHSCTSDELQKASEGHFSIMHTPFGEMNTIMKENITVAEWLESHTSANESLSNYTGFAYDAVWAYALAADKLLHENNDSVNNLRSSNVVKRFVELIWQTDFQGLSGHIRFGQGGSRITDLDIMQWRQLQFHHVGKFYPNIVGVGNNMHTDGGHLVLNQHEVEWLSDVQPPTDGTYDCSFAALAEFLGTDCDSAAFAFTAVLCLFAVILVSLLSFMFWKQRYDKKLKQSAKIMKNFGIDLLSPSRNKSNTLDKWEVPKENVVLNRRLGEGAFGTVYGGEAQIGASGWTAIAVKTLKAGASTEDRLDFLSEAEAMKRFDHKNIVKLLGVCLQSEPIYTIMEFMLYGDLKTYLLARRDMVYDKLPDDADISSKRLTSYAMDVARGLAYLASQKYVHRDLACRNCLVNAQRVVKLGDFGMARSTYESDYYRFNRRGMLPVRWMAPESLSLGMFTPASDVWAFGVVLYEMITFCSRPYQGLSNNQVLEFIISGKTLQIPMGVKPHLEGLIKACWSQEPKKRPTANEVVDYISSYPRLLTPCVDFPSASVEMTETESDELELLPKTRKCSPIKKDSTLDILAETPTMNHFERSGGLIEDIELSEHTNIEMPHEPIPINANHLPSINSSSNSNSNSNTSNNSNNINNNLEDFSPITPDGYSIMTPLLMHQVSEVAAGKETLQQTSFST